MPGELVSKINCSTTQPEIAPAQDIRTDKINPGCWLKTRSWPVVETTLVNIVEAADLVRQQGLGDLEGTRVSA